MKIRPAGAVLFHADGRTDRPIDMTKLIVAFGNFANPPKNSAGLSGNCQAAHQQNTSQPKFSHLSV